ncbi:MAG TPA: hypothetical protein QGF95_12380 [Candidatus Latescibacteria bacterium]|nr:hypothetical protein [Candidatus Latescibacterota bacterium]
MVYLREQSLQVMVRQVGECIEPRSDSPAQFRPVLEAIVSGDNVLCLLKSYFSRENVGLGGITKAAQMRFDSVDSIKVPLLESPVELPGFVLEVPETGIGR